MSDSRELIQLKAENKSFRAMLKVERNLVDDVESLENQLSMKQDDWLSACDEIDALKEALQGWMIDHGDRCRVCMDRSQRALKGTF